MDLQTKLYLEREKYRKDNHITGEYYEFNFINPIKEENKEENKEEKIRCHESLKNKLRPIGLTLYDNKIKKYHILEDAMTWSIQMITDDLEKFEEDTKDNWSGEKGKLRNQNCWSVLQEIQYDTNFQNWCLIFPGILQNDINSKINIS